MKSRNQLSSISFGYQLAAAVMLMVISLLASALVARARSHEPEASPASSPVVDSGLSSIANSVKATSSTQDVRTVAVTNQVEPPRSDRNLSLQPEGLRASRKLGKRFAERQRTVFTASGTLTNGGTTQAVQLVRRQTQRGEGIEIALGGAPASLTWNEREGARSSGQAATDTERKLIERLTFDSPDQLVLAQLRGARYSTIAQKVRPEQADENYSGVLYDIVRIDDPDSDEQSRPQSRWRLYYINSRSGLINKVVSEINGDQVEAVFSGWREQAGEKFPTHIVWTRQGETLMELSLQNFSMTSAQ